jgi:hypothetical protein
MMKKYSTKNNYFKNWDERKLVDKKMDESDGKRYNG